MVKWKKIIYEMHYEMTVSFMKFFRDYHLQVSANAAFRVKSTGLLLSYIFRFSNFS